MVKKALPEACRIMRWPRLFPMHRSISLLAPRQGRRFRPASRSRKSFGVRCPPPRGIGAPWVPVVLKESVFGAFALAWDVDWFPECHGVSGLGGDNSRRKRLRVLRSEQGRAEVVSRYCCSHPPGEPRSGQKGVSRNYSPQAHLDEAKTRRVQEMRLERATPFGRAASGGFQRLGVVPNVLETNREL